jgi:cytoskeletal protein RodZ
METGQTSRTGTGSLQRPGMVMGSVASELKLEREKRKISLAQIAADTRISLRYLQSLEEGRYSDLPGGESLNLDQREIIRRYEAEMSPLSEKSPKAKVHIPEQSHSLRPSPIIIWTLALLISAIGLFFSRKWIAEVFSPYFAHSPAADVRYESPAQTDASRAAKPAAPAATASAQPSVPPASTPLNSPEPSTESKASRQTPVQAAAIPAGEESGLSTSKQSLRLDVAVTGQCWISVDRDGNPAFRKLLEPGEVQTLGAAEKFYIIVGNAGAVRLKINGKLLKPIGRPGEVIKLLIDGKSLPDLIDPTAG